MSDDKKPDAEEFAAVLIKHAGGLAHDEASEKLRDAVEAAKETGKPAKVTVELSIKPVANVPNAVKMSSNVTASIPKEPVSSMWFADDDGGLHRNDPTQRSLWDTPTTEATDSKSAAAGRD